MDAWITTQQNRLVAFRTYDEPQFAELVVTRYPGEPTGFAWIGPTYLPLRVTWDLFQSGVFPWKLGVVRQDALTRTVVLARRDGWRVCVFLAYWLVARLSEGSRTL